MSRVQEKNFFKATPGTFRNALHFLDQPRSDPLEHVAKDNESFESGLPTCLPVSRQPIQLLKLARNLITALFAVTTSHLTAIARNVNDFQMLCHGSKQGPPNRTIWILP